MLYFQNHKSTLGWCAFLAILAAVQVDKFWALQTPSSMSAETQKLAREIFRELVEINIIHDRGITKAAEAMAMRLRAAGYPPQDIQVLGPQPTKHNLVARLRGNGNKRPLLFIAHLDVVEARPEDWSVDPFRFLERDGYFYGRGTSDIKDEGVGLIANLVRLRKENFLPDRDLIVALTDDEETGGDANGVAWLLAHQRKLIDAEYCINPDAGGGVIRKGRHVLLELQTGEKVYVSFQLEVKNRGGHSSLPVKDNAIYRLAQGLTRLSQFEFPIEWNETTHNYFEKMATRESGQTAKDMMAVVRRPLNLEVAARLAASSPYYNALMRSTCVATQLMGGHAENALPQSARAIVNCRLLPEDPPDDVQRILEQVVADKEITVSRLSSALPSPLTPLNQEVLQSAEQISREMWPGVIVAPVISTGASDGVHLRRAGVPVYGVSGTFADVDDTRAHGRDERIGVTEFYDGVEFMYRLMKALSSDKQ